MKSVDSERLILFDGYIKMNWFCTFSHFYLIYLIHICMVSSPYKVISTFRNALSYPHNNQCHFLDSSKQEMVCGCNWEVHPVDSPICLDTEFDELRPKNDFWLSLCSPWMKKCILVHQDNTLWHNFDVPKIYLKAIVNLYNGIENIIVVWL